MRKYFLVLILLLATNVSAVTIKDKVNRAEKLYLSENFLNAIFMFADNNKPLIIGAKGIFSLNGEQLKANEVMPIASGTKPITAAAILKLQEQNKLNVHDKIAKYLDKDLWRGPVPSWVYKISIHNLLTHTSGLPDYFSFVKLDLSMSQKTINKHIMQFVASKPLEEEIGKKFKYSNTNFIILGMIIEKVSGQSLGKFFEKEFFTPLNMKSTKLAAFGEVLRIQENATSSNYPLRYYIQPTGGKPIFTPADMDFIVVPYADGGVVSTTADMIKWYRALHHHKIISKASYKLMIAKYFPTYNKNGKNTYTGYGIFITELPDKNLMIHHSGSALGIRSESGFLLGKNIYFSILSNVMVKIPKDIQIDMNNKANQLDIVYFRDAIINAAISK